MEYEDEMTKPTERIVRLRGWLESIRLIWEEDGRPAPEKCAEGMYNLAVFALNEDGIGMWECGCGNVNPPKTEQCLKCGCDVHLHGVEI